MKIWGRWWAGKGKRVIIIRWFSLSRNPIPLPQDNTLGSQIKYLRRCLGETQTSFASLCGHPVSLVAKYEQNGIKKPNYQVLLGFAKTLKVSPDKLLSIQEFRPISSETELDSLFDYLVPTKDFGSKLRNLRLRANIGQKALAKRIGLNRESIRRYERNITRPTKEILIYEHYSGQLVFEYNKNKEVDKETFEEYEDLLIEATTR